MSCCWLWFFAHLRKSTSFLQPSQMTGSATSSTRTRGILRRQKWDWPILRGNNTATPSDKRTRVLVTRRGHQNGAKWAPKTPQESVKDTFITMSIKRRATAVKTGSNDFLTLMKIRWKWPDGVIFSSFASWKSGGKTFSMELVQNLQDSTWKCPPFWHFFSVPFEVDFWWKEGPLESRESSRGQSESLQCVCPSTQQFFPGLDGHACAQIRAKQASHGINFSTSIICHLHQGWVGNQPSPWPRQ